MFVAVFYLFFFLPPSCFASGVLNFFTIYNTPCSVFSYEWWFSVSFWCVTTVRLSIIWSGLCWIWLAYLWLFWWLMMMIVLLIIISTTSLHFFFYWYNYQIDYITDTSVMLISRLDYRISLWKYALEYWY